MKVLKTTQAADALQVSKETVLLMIQSGALPATRLRPTGHWRIRQDELERFAQQRGIELLPIKEK